MKKTASTKAPPKGVDMTTFSNQDKAFLSAMKDLCTCSLNIIAGKESNQSKCYTYALSYENSLKQKGIKLDAHRNLYNNLYKKHSKMILSCANNPQWMGECTEVVVVHLGADIPKLKERGMRLQLSAVSELAEEMRTDIESKHYKNENQKEIAMGSTKYQYIDLFHYFFVRVIAESLGPDHQDYPELVEIYEIFRDRTHLKKTTKDEGEEGEADEDGEGEGGDYIANLLAKKTGKKIKKSKINDMFSKILDEENGLMSAMDDVKEMGAQTDKKKATKNILSAMMPKIEDLIDGFDELVDGGNDDEED